MKLEDRYGIIERWFSEASNDLEEGSADMSKLWSTYDDLRHLAKENSLEFYHSHELHCYLNRFFVRTLEAYMPPEYDEAFRKNIEDILA